MANFRQEQKVGYFQDSNFLMTDGSDTTYLQPSEEPMQRRTHYVFPVLCLLLAACSRAAPPTVSVSLTPAPNSPLPIVVYCIAIADVNSDRHQDLIITS